MATLKDISKELDISVATVSRALNGFPEVSEKTRNLVQATASRLNYRPNKAAQKLVSGRSDTVGLLMELQPGLSAESALVDVMMGLSACLVRRDIDLVVQALVEEDPLVAYRRALAKNTLDGFILNAPQVNDRRIDLLMAQDVPFVVHGRVGKDPKYAFYDLDNADVSVQAVRFLSALRHRNIVLLNGPSAAVFSQQRTQGFVTALAALGLPAPELSVSYGPNNRHSGYARTLSLLGVGGELGRATAVLCASTQLAYGCLRAAADMGLSVPQDLSVMCHDDVIPNIPSHEAQVALTITRAPLTDACEPLADSLVAVLNGASPLDHQTTAKAELVVRQSTGPAPG